MPDDPWLWALAITVGGVIVIVALVKGGAVEVRLDPPSLKFRRRSDGAQSRTSVLEGAEIEESDVGDVTAAQRGAGAPGTGGGTVEVGKGLKVKKSKLGDITAVSTRGSGGADGPARPDD